MSASNNGRGRGRGRGGYGDQYAPVQQPVQPGIHSPHSAPAIPNNAAQQAPQPPAFGFRGIYPGDVHHDNRQQMPPPLDYDPWSSQHMHPSLYGHTQHVGFQPTETNRYPYQQNVPQPQYMYSSYGPPATVQPHQVLLSQRDYGLAGPQGAPPQPFGDRQHYLGPTSPIVQGNTPYHAGQQMSLGRSPQTLASHTPMFRQGSMSHLYPASTPSQQALGARRNHSMLSVDTDRPRQAPPRITGPSPSEMSFQISASTPGNQSGRSLATYEGSQEVESPPSGIVRSDTNDVPKWLQKKDGKYSAQSFPASYQSSEQKWYSQDHLNEQFETLMVRPQPQGGDKGIPANDEEELAFAKQVYDCIVDFSQFYGSNAGPVTALLDGSAFPSWYIQKRAMDVAVTLREYHTDGFPVTDYSNPNVSSKTGEKSKGSEQDDTCEERMRNILDALRYSKQVACDVLMGKESLASALILAPKQKIKAKLQYLQSNQSRAESNKTVKAEMEKTKKRKRESLGEAQRDETQLEETQLGETQLDGAQDEEDETPRTRSGRLSRKPKRF